MSSIIARRRHPAAGYAAVAVGLVAVGVLYSTLAGGGASAAAPAQASTSIAQGKSLFEQSCSSCHGLDAQGTSQAPSLIGAGAAAVYFQMSTGRMPAKELGAENDRKPTDFTEQQIYAIAAYIASLGGGPPIPSEADVSTEGANTALGEELFSTNCAQCHGFAGAGGALTYGKNAPSLNASTPTQIYTAMLTGPEAMPVFGDGTITPQEKRDIIAFITDTRNEPNPGGLSLARTGTVTEGLLIWIGGLGFLILIAMWLTARRRDRAIDEHGGDHVPGDHAATETAEQAESEHSS
ncbi:MAG: c-type cytochrome [Trebonia sp.]|uniref:cytochrome bc1 complex diheme cytochrome c subunit n=1 Tax=Trebonia sp. TaxID=2767075 RepID=UPI003BE18166